MFGFISATEFVVERIFTPTPPTLPTLQIKDLRSNKVPTCWVAFHRAQPTIFLHLVVYFCATPKGRGCNFRGDGGRVEKYANIKIVVSPTISA